MDTLRSGSRFVFAALAAFAGTAGAAQPDGVSPYSFALSVTHAPLAAACPGTRLLCAREPGLDVSLVGRAQLSAFNLFGKVGTTTYTRPDTSVMGMAPLAGPEPGSALSWGGGVSYDITPRLSAAFEWVSYDLHVNNGPLRTTTLGLKYRY